MRTLQARLTTAIFLGMITFLGVTGELLNRYLSAEMLRQYDETLLAKAMTLVTLTTQNQGRVELDFADEFMPEFERDERPEYFQIWLRNGDVLERSRSVEITFSPHMKDKDRYFSNGEEEHIAEWSSLTLTTIVVAKGLDTLNTFTAAIRWVLLATFSFLAIATGVFTWFVVRRGLNPVRDVAQQVKLLRISELDRHVMLQQGADELKPVIDQINELLNRTQQAFQRETRFSDNVAHELRTPLAELRAMSEVALKWPNDIEVTDNLASEVFDVTVDMESVVRNLLMLARCESNTFSIENSKVDLRYLINKIWSRFSDNADNRGLKLLNTVSDDVVVTIDRDQLSLILKNLLNNTLAYSVKNTEVQVSFDLIGDQDVLSVSNETKDLTGQDVPYLFDRFWRKDPARSRGGHAGLGLSLVKSISQMLHLHISVSLSNQRLDISLRNVHEIT